MDIDSLRQWIGRTESSEDVVTAAPVLRLSATLDREDAAPHIGEELPPLWHWLYFLPAHRQSELGHDGHAKLGDFLPPVPLPRRMWAGSRLDFHHPLRVGDTIARTSKIVDVRSKEGRTGQLMFVLVRHEISTPEHLAITEEQDIVYRGAGSQPGAPRLVSAHASWKRTIQPDDVLLFRYSALTFNGHRIHYDRRYAESEDYPGLVVHGPLIATLLLDLLRRNVPQANVARFEFRAVSPLFDTGPFEVCGREADGAIALWAQNSSGVLAMEATAILR